MLVVNVHEAKTRLSQLLAQVESGGEIIIARAGKHVARLSPILEQGDLRRFGQDRGLFEVPEDFDEPLPDELLREFHS
jgi:prevent-host-death family protein